MARKVQAETARREKRLAQRIDAFLSRLEHNGVYIAPVDPGGSRMAFRRASDGHARRCAAADAHIFGICRERGLVEQARDGTWHLAAPGRAWRRRHATPHAPFLAQHADLGQAHVEVGGVRHQATIDHSESPLTWLYRRRGRNGARLVSPEQFAAGERLRSDFTRAHLMPSITSRWDAALGRDKQRKGPAGTPVVESAMMARQRVESAMSVVGPELSGVLVDVCCFLKRLEEVEQANGWPARSAKLVLCLGLTRLARHYGLLAPANECTAALRHWGAEDYRPEI